MKKLEPIHNNIEPDNLAVHVSKNKSAGAAGSASDLSEPRDSIPDKIQLTDEKLKIKDYSEHAFKPRPDLTIIPDTPKGIYLLGVLGTSSALMDVFYAKSASGFVAAGFWFIVSFALILRFKFARILTLIFSFILIISSAFIVMGARAAITTENSKYLHTQSFLNDPYANHPTFLQFARSTLEDEHNLKIRSLKILSNIAYAQMVVSVVIILYLFTPGVRQAFEV